MTKPEAVPVAVPPLAVAPARSFRRQMFWLVTAIILGSGALLAALVMSHRAAALRSAERVTEALAQVIAEQTTRSFQAIDQRLQLSLARVEQVDRTNPNEGAVRALLRQEIAEFPFVRAVSVSNANGRIIYSTDEESVGGDLSDRAYFQIYHTEPQTTFHIGPPVRGRPSGSTWLITATRPRKSASGAFAGVMVAAVDPSFFDRLWQTPDLGKGGTISLFQRDGMMMMRSPFDEAGMGKVFTNLGIFSQPLATRPAGHFVGTSVVDGTRRLFGYRVLPAHPQLIVVVGQAYGGVLSPWRQLALIVFSVWAAASLVIATLGVFLDRAMAERIQSTADAEHMSKRLALATEASLIGVWDWDLKADSWYATPTYFSLLGYGPDQGVRDRGDWLQHVHPEDRDVVASNIDAALAGEDVPYRHDARVLHADGGYRWVSVIGRVLERDEQGKPRRLLGVMMDITEMKRANEALQRQQAELRVLFDLMPAMISFKNTEDKILRINQRAASVVGLSVEEIEGRLSREVYPREAERFYADDRRVIQSGQPELGMVERILENEGRELWVRTDKVPYRDKDGRVIGLVVMAQDITESKRAEETLREREELFSAAFEHAPIGMALVSPEGRWLRVNRALCDLVGYTDAELLARTFQDITHPDDLHADLQSMKQLLDGETSSYQMEKRYVHASGKHVNVLLSVSLVRDSRGAPRYMIAQIQDITERKRASAALEASLHEKEGLLKEVHHRVKNNLQVITSLLRLEAGRSAEPATRMVLQDMRGRIHSMALLHEMLYRTANFARVELADYLRRLATHLVRGQDAASGTISLSLDLKSVEVDIDRAIPAALIVNELLSNSLKHAFPEGRPGEVRLALNVDSAGLVRLCVSDTGVGLSPDFEARRNKSLGLQLVSDLSRQLGGSFEIERTPETTFTVTFPQIRKGS